MKKTGCVLLALLALASLSACARARQESYPLTVNGTPLNDELFLYYLDLAYADESYRSKEERIAAATQSCIRYVAVNSAFLKLGLSLSAAEKADCTERANALWRVFGEHYRALGVSKETFLKIQTSNMYIETMRYALFDRDGSDPIPDEVLRGYFAANYVSVKLVRGDLFDTDVYGNRVDYSEEVLEGILERYSEAAEQINGGVAIDFMYASLICSGNEEVSGALKTEIIPKDDPNYPEGFFEAVENIAVGRAGLAVFGDFLYLVYRVNILSDPDFFEDHRRDCLLVVSEPYLQNEITDLCNGYTSVRKTAAVEECCRRVEEHRSAL